MEESLKAGIEYIDTLQPEDASNCYKADEIIWHYRQGYESRQPLIDDMIRVLKMTLACIDNDKYSNVCQDIKDVLAI